MKYRKMLSRTRLFRWTLAAGLCAGWETYAGESTGAIRARLLATRLETELTVELRNGEKWKGSLAEIHETSFLVLAEPDKETRKRLRLGSGMKLKKTLAFDDVVGLEGGVASEIVEKYLVLGADDAASMHVRLAAAAAGGYRVRASAGLRVVVLENVESDSLTEYALFTISEKGEKDLDDLGAQGFRVVPRTLGSRLGTPSLILERRVDEADPCDYRVLAAAREGTLEKELKDAAAQGYGVVGLTTTGQKFVLLEAVVPSAGTETAPPDYRLLWDLDSTLSQQPKDGYRLIACSDGERLCVFQKTSDPLDDDAYLFLGAKTISTLEKELNEAALRGYRLHPGAFGVEGEGIWFAELFAILEKPGSTLRFEYRVFSSDRTSKIQEEVALAAREGFQVVALTSGKKDMSGTGFTLGGTVAPIDVLVVMERSTSK
jgi:hypothetical protein